MKLPSSRPPGDSIQGGNTQPPAMRYVHTWWTRPTLGDSAARPPAFTPPKDYEALTWLASALQARSLGRVRLVTDRLGVGLVARLALDWVYDDGVIPLLDEVPASVLPRVFWSAGQLYALRSVQAPCASVDLDVLLWAPVEPSAPVVALLQEDRDWPYYRCQQERYARFGFEDASWDWSVQPVNAGMVSYFDDAVRASYLDVAIDWVERFSREARANAYWGKDPRKDFDDAPVFVDQRLLPMHVRRQGERIGTVGHLHPHAPHLLPNPTCAHLWFTKRWYDACPTARRAFCDYLRTFLRQAYPEAGPTLDRWDRDGLIAQGSDGGLPVPRGFELSFSLLEDVQGTIWITDSNVRARRQARGHDMLFVAEGLEASPGASYRLVAGGQFGVRVKHLAEGQTPARRKGTA